MLVHKVKIQTTLHFQKVDLMEEVMVVKRVIVDLVVEVRLIFDLMMKEMFYIGCDVAFTQII